jgi:hypothetical protein
LGCRGGTDLPGAVHYESGSGLLDRPWQPNVGDEWHDDSIQPGRPGTETILPADDITVKGALA